MQTFVLISIIYLYQFTFVNIRIKKAKKKKELTKKNSRLYQPNFLFNNIKYYAIVNLLKPYNNNNNKPDPIIKSMSNNIRILCYIQFCFILFYYQ